MLLFACGIIAAVEKLTGIMIVGSFYCFSFDTEMQ